METKDFCHYSKGTTEYWEILRSVFIYFTYVEVDEEVTGRIANVSMLIPTNWARPSSAVANIESSAGSFLSSISVRKKVV